MSGSIHASAGTIGGFDIDVNSLSFSSSSVNSAGSDGTGNADGWKQSWILNAPYEGEYTLKGTVDNFGIIEVDGVEVASRKDDPDVAFVDDEHVGNHDYDDNTDDDHDNNKDIYVSKKDDFVQNEK